MLQADACGPGYTFDSNTRLMLEKKDDMRRRGAASPDHWDAAALTFAESVAPQAGWSRRLVYSDLGVVRGVSTRSPVARLERSDSRERRGARASPNGPRRQLGQRLSLFPATPTPAVRGGGLGQWPTRTRDDGILRLMRSD